MLDHVMNRVSKGDAWMKIGPKSAPQCWTTIGINRRKIFSSPNILMIFFFILYNIMILSGKYNLKYIITLSWYFVISPIFMRVLVLPCSCHLYKKVQERALLFSNMDPWGCGCCQVYLRSRSAVGGTRAKLTCLPEFTENNCWPPDPTSSYFSSFNRILFPVVKGEI